MIKLTVDGRMYGLSGIGRYIKELLPYFNDMYSMEVIGSPEKFKCQKYVYTPAESKIYSLKEQFELYLKIRKCDIFWSPHYNIPLLPVKASTRVVTIHDVYHLAFSQQFSWYKRMYSRYMINQAVKRSDLILTDSEFSKSEIIKFTGTTKKIHVVYCGTSIDVNSCKSVKTPLLSFDYLLYVGNVKPHKNLSRALEAFERLSDKFPDLHFVVVGKREDFITGDVSFIEKALQNEKVVFTGYVKDESLINYYKFAKLLFFPSMYEGFGLTPLEAQACGTPCVVSNVASLPEVCGDSVAYCDPLDVGDMVDKIELLLLNPSLRDSLVEKGYENITRFSWKKSAEQINEILKRLNESCNCS